MTGCPRIAYLTSQYPQISQTFIQREVEGLRRHGFDVMTFSVHRTPPSDLLSAADRREASSTTALRERGLLRAVGDNLRVLLRDPVRYLRVACGAVAGGPPGLKARTWQLFYLAQAASLSRACRDAGIRHVHAHFANNAADIARLTAQIGSRDEDRWTWSFTMHGPTEFADVTRFGLARKAVDATFVACISEYARGQLMGLTPPDRWPSLHVVHCGVDPAAFAPVDRSGRDGALRVLTVGRLVAEKGLGVLLDAVSGLTRRGVPVDLVVVGDGPLRNTWLKQARDIGIEGSVRFLGALGQEDLRVWFDWADVFCLTSFAEGVPVVLMEAMACGLPVVSSRIAGIPELVEHGVSGFLPPAGSVDGVVSAIEKLWADPARREALGRHGREAVTSRYSAADEAGRLAALFLRHAATRTDPACGAERTVLSQERPSRDTEGTPRETG